MGGILSEMADFDSYDFGGVPLTVISTLPNVGPSSSSSILFDLRSSTLTLAVGTPGHAISAMLSPLSLIFANRTGWKPPEGVVAASVKGCRMVPSCSNSICLGQCSCMCVVA